VNVSNNNKSQRANGKSKREPELEVRGGYLRFEVIGDTEVRSESFLRDMRQLVAVRELSFHYLLQDMQRIAWLSVVFEEGCGRGVLRE